MNKQVEQIRTEIERLYKEAKEEPYTGRMEGRLEALDKLDAFIDSLEEEPVSEDLEQAAVEAFKHIVDSDKNNFYEIFKAGANWQKEQMMKDAVDAYILQSFNPVTESIEIDRHGFKCEYGQKKSTPYVIAGEQVKLVIIKEE